MGNESVRKRVGDAKAEAESSNFMQLHCLFFNKPTYDVRAATKALNDNLTARQYVVMQPRGRYEDGR